MNMMMMMMMMKPILQKFCMRQLVNIFNTVHATEYKIQYKTHKALLKYVLFVTVLDLLY